MDTNLVSHTGYRVQRALQYLSASGALHGGNIHQAALLLSELRVLLRTLNRVLENPSLNPGVFLPTQSGMNLQQPSKLFKTDVEIAAALGFLCSFATPDTPLTNFLLEHGLVVQNNRKVSVNPELKTSDDYMSQRTNVQRAVRLAWDAAPDKNAFTRNLKGAMRFATSGIMTLLGIGRVESYEALSEDIQQVSLSGGGSWWSDTKSAIFSYFKLPTQSIFALVATLAEYWNTPQKRERITSYLKNIWDNRVIPRKYREKMKWFLDKSYEEQDRYRQLVQWYVEALEEKQRTNKFLFYFQVSTSLYIRNRYRLLCSFFRHQFGVPNQPELFKTILEWVFTYYRNASYAKFNVSQTFAKFKDTFLDLQKEFSEYLKDKPVQTKPLQLTYTFENPWRVDHMLHDISKLFLEDAAEQYVYNSITIRVPLNFSRFVEIFNALQICVQAQFGLVTKTPTIQVVLYDPEGICNGGSDYFKDVPNMKQQITEHIVKTYNTCIGGYNKFMRQYGEFVNYSSTRAPLELGVVPKFDQTNVTFEAPFSEPIDIYTPRVTKLEMTCSGNYNIALLKTSADNLFQPKELDVMFDVLKISCPSTFTLTLNVLKYVDGKFVVNTRVMHQGEQGDQYWNFWCLDHSIRASIFKVDKSRAIYYMHYFALFHRMQVIDCLLMVNEQGPRFHIGFDYFVQIIGAYLGTEKLPIVWVYSQTEPTLNESKFFGLRNAGSLDYACTWNPFGELNVFSFEISRSTDDILRVTSPYRQPASTWFWYVLMSALPNGEHGTWTLQNNKKDVLPESKEKQVFPEIAWMIDPNLAANDIYDEEAFIITQYAYHLTSESLEDGMRRILNLSTSSEPSEE